MDVTVNQEQADLLQSAAYRHHLGDNVFAFAPAVEHTLKAPHLTFDAVETANKTLATLNGGAGNLV